MKSVQEDFPLFYEKISEAHENIHGGHDMYHVQRVATWARRISLNECWNDEQTARLAEIAAYCHNADRLKEKIYGRDNTPDNATEELVRSWLCHIPTLSPQHVMVILQAVLCHSKPNETSDSNVTIALKDADRLVNLELDVIIRSGQFHPEIPAVDYKLFLSDQEATYKKPKSCLRDIYHCLDWADPEQPAFCCRTRLGQEVARKRAFYLQGFIDLLKAQLLEDGLTFKT